MVLFHVGRSDAHTYSHSAPYHSPDEHIRESGGMGHRDFHGIQYGRDQPLSTGGAGSCGIFLRSRRCGRRNGSSLCENVRYFRDRCRYPFHAGILRFLPLASVRKYISCAAFQGSVFIGMSCLLRFSLFSGKGKRHRMKDLFHTKDPAETGLSLYIRSGAACLLRNFFPERSTMRRSGHSSCLHPCKTGRIYYSGGRKQRWYHSRGNSPRDPIPRNSHNLS